MREQSERATAPSTDQGRRRIDLSLAQVAASALAAVVGAVLASELGVYGTIIGAAVVSVGATTGGALFQHLFRRTGEQLREATDRGPGKAVNDLQQVPLTETAPLPSAWRAEAGPSENDWNDSGVFRARRRWSWKTYAAVSALVFVVAMTPILIVEQATGKSVRFMTTGHDDGGNSLLPGGGRSSGDRAPTKPTGGDPAASPSPSPGDGSGAKAGSGGAGASMGPSSSGAATAPATPSGSPSPTPSAGSTPSGTPSAPSTPSPSGASSPSGAPSTPSTPSTGAATPPAVTPPADTSGGAPTGRLGTTPSP
ncbi:hypothetical protein [Kitasatospora kifunensis]|uniref:Uncharacterized protein n=1 Tax=Kitasatospora kifunensis TaxID=58351 RepID=A0A7W7VWN4_KITKI|nr:hypothetical protein [Kitasatospora kifunensis]MBB4925692.1 hypothetical protein [Kitasatospora kifunensis]